MNHFPSLNTDLSTVLRSCDRPGQRAEAQQRRDTRIEDVFRIAQPSSHGAPGMSWLGLIDHAERRFSLRGIGHDRQDRRLFPDVSGALMTRGSIVFEARIAPEGRPHMLCGFDSSWPIRRSLAFRAIPGGGISLVQVTDRHVAHAAVEHATFTRMTQLRVTFAWDCDHGIARLSVERPETREVTTIVVDGVQPIALADLHGFILGRGVQTFAPDMIFLALSDRMEPVGPAPSIAPKAQIATPCGYRQAGSLQRGDTVLTRDGGIVPVLHRVDRTVPARGSFAPLRLRAPYFGLQEDLAVSPEQRLVIEGSEVEYLFGQEAVLVPARHLLNGFAARAESAGPTVRYTQLILPGHESLVVAGAALESLYIGRLRRNLAQIDATVLRGINRNSLPEHARPIHTELQWYDAIHLARQRVA
jgi:hypothetical protein